jgi:hypothetical protein
MQTVSALGALTPSRRWADETNHLAGPCVLTASKRFDHGAIWEYQIALPENHVAVLRLEPGKGWALNILSTQDNIDIDRGLFATPLDALMVVSAETRTSAFVE